MGKKLHLSVLCGSVVKKYYRWPFFINLIWKRHLNWASLNESIWGCSSDGRARRSQRRGQGFDPPHLHFNKNSNLAQFLKIETELFLVPHVVPISFLDQMSLDEDDFTLIKIKDYLTWQPPIMISVFLARLWLHLKLSKNCFPRHWSPLQCQSELLLLPITLRPTLA